MSDVLPRLLANHEALLAVRRRKIARDAMRRDAARGSLESGQWKRSKSAKQVEPAKPARRAHGGAAEPGGGDDGLQGSDRAPGGAQENQRLPATAPGQVDWILDQVEDYLLLKAGKQKMESISEFVRKCQDRYASAELLDSELLQIVNICPTEYVALYAILDQCDSRLTNEEIDSMLGLVKELLL